MAFRLGRIVHPLHRFFDWLYHSGYNPLYRSGTLAVGFLIVLLVTGLYLLFFYSVSAPYQSLVDIQSQIYLGRWIRAVHRYATDGVIVATIFHVLQLLVQGKTWGPRTLAWISGIVLLGILLLSAWTGYILVWDTHSQSLAIAGAKILQLFPFLQDTVASAFNGTNPVTPSFFFMNLFLHVALPVGVIFGLWVHTAKISRSRWFPIRPIFIWSTVAFLVLGIVWPVTLMPEADLLSLPGKVPTDLLVGFWIPLVSRSPLWTFTLLTIFVFFLASMPWWWRPNKEAIRKSSVVDAERCTGCTQCARDCPYEAIIMVPRDDGRRLVAQVQSESCVSCGICAASCGDVCVGPPERSGREQLEQIELFSKKEFPEVRPFDVTVIVCKHNGAVPDRWKEFANAQPGFHLHFADCCGTVHTQVMERLFQECGGVFFHACPERNCFNRDGLDLLTQRIFYKRVPFLAREIDRRRLMVDASSEQETAHALSRASAFHEFIRDVSDEKRPPAGTKDRTQVVRRFLATPILLVLLAFMNQAPIGKEQDYAVVRLGAKFPGQTALECRSLSEEERKQLPLHMQLPEVCEKQQITYSVKIIVDGRELLSDVFARSNLRGDGMFFVNEEVKILPGSHQVTVLVKPETNELKESDEVQSTLELSREIVAEARKIYLISYDRTLEKLELING